MRVLLPTPEPALQLTPRVGATKAGDVLFQNEGLQLTPPCGGELQISCCS